MDCISAGVRDLWLFMFVNTMRFFQKMGTDADLCGMAIDLFINKILSHKKRVWHVLSCGESVCAMDKLCNRQVQVSM